MTFRRRWDARNSGWGYRVLVQNVEIRATYFMFDAVLERTIPGSIPNGPFVFHLHDSYPKSVILDQESPGK